MRKYGIQVLDDGYNNRKALLIIFHVKKHDTEINKIIITTDFYLLWAQTLMVSYCQELLHEHQGFLGMQTFLAPLTDAIKEFIHM